MSPATHLIQRLIVDLEARDPTAAREAQARWEGLFESILAPVIERVCDAHDPGEETVVMNRLNLDLGDVGEDLDADDVADRVESKLRNALMNALGSRATSLDSPDGDPVGQTPEPRVLHFLRTGLLPWWSGPPTGGALATELQALLVRHEPTIRSWLIRHAGDARIIRRTVLQFGPQRAAGLTRVLLRTVAVSPAETVLETCRELERGTPERLEKAWSIIADHGLSPHDKRARLALTLNVKRDVSTRFHDPGALSTSTADRETEAAPAAGEFTDPGTPPSAGDETEGMATGSDTDAHQHSDPCRPTADDTPTPRADDRPDGEGDREPVGRDRPAPPKKPATPARDRDPDASDPATGLERTVEKRGTESGPRGPIPANEPLSREGREPRRSGRTVDPTASKPWAPEATEPDRSVRATGPGMNRFAPGREGLAVQNSGLVILWPFLPAFLERTGVRRMDAGWASEEAPRRAAHLLQYLATGDSDRPEHELVLNKILCGLALDEPLPLDIELTAHERAQSENLLEQVVLHWTALKQTSIRGLRLGFLARTGRVEIHEAQWLLRVERQTRDVLLDRLPWGISRFQLSWMNRSLEVQW